MENKMKECKILGKVYKLKPLKLRLNKDSYCMIQKLNNYVKETTGLTDDEIRDEKYSFAVSLAIMGFLSFESNCTEIFYLLIDEAQNWEQLIAGNKDKYDEIKKSSINILNDFFLSVSKLMNGQESSSGSLNTLPKDQI